jgi:two-component system cell cycle response regulator
VNLRILILEPDPEYLQFLREVLMEIESGRYWSNWVRFDTLDAACWDEAAAMLASEPIDILLLDTQLPDCRGLETFHRAQTIASSIPMILLAEPDDEDAAVRMVREGAQDFLLKTQVDCAPLAHAIRNAVERHRLLSAARAAVVTDSLTGLPNRVEFFTFADRDRKLAERLRRRLMILVAEPKNLTELATAFGEQRRDLALVEAADHLRSLAGPADLVARIGETRFGIAIFDTDFESVEEAWARIHAAAFGHRMLVGAAIFDSDHPASLDALLHQAALDLAPSALAMRL